MKEEIIGADCPRCGSVLPLSYLKDDPLKILSTTCVNCGLGPASGITVKEIIKRLKDMAYET